MKYLSEVYGKGGIYAKVVAASVANDIPIYTLETCAPKFIDAEFEKHRMLSSNSSSSRAIPFRLLMQEERYFPFDIRKNEKGMQGYKRAEEETFNRFSCDLDELENITNEYLYKYKDIVHKQHLNRYLEPWMFQKKVVTATEWDNFFKLRMHPDAQPEIQELARCMKEAIDSVEPTKLKPGQWHLPYLEFNDLRLYSDIKEIRDVSAARCARVSYLNHDKTDTDYVKDIKLAERLMKDGHMSPFEHQATPMHYTNTHNSNWYNDIWSEEHMEMGSTHVDRDGNFWSANFRGWIQNRQLVQ